MDEIYYNWIGPGLLSFPLHSDPPDIVDNHNNAKMTLLENHSDYIESK